MPRLERIQIDRIGPPTADEFNRLQTAIERALEKIAAGTSTATSTTVVVSSTTTSGGIGGTFPSVLQADDSDDRQDLPPAPTPQARARFWISAADPSVPFGVDMSALGSGVLKQTVASGVSTPGLVTISTGLAYADPTMTAWLSTGIAGGQSAIGGTAAGENLTLSSTTNGTKGQIRFGSAAASYDEANSKFLAPDGSTTVPSYAFTNFPTNGFSTIVGGSRISGIIGGTRVIDFLSGLVFILTNGGSASLDLLNGGGGIQGVGSGINVISVGGAVGLYTSNVRRILLDNSGMQTHTVAAVTSGSPTMVTITGAAYTGLTASIEAIDLNYNLARTVQFSTGGLTTQRAFYIQAPTYGFVGASTITDAATLAISGGPIAGTNATITRSLALWVQGGGVRLDGLGSTGIVKNTNGGVLSIANSADVAGAITWPAAKDVLFSTGTSTAPSGSSAWQFDSGSGNIALMGSIIRTNFNLGGPDFSGNWEGIVESWAANVWSMESQKAGTGTVRAMKFDAHTADLTLNGNAVRLNGVANVITISPSISMSAAFGTSPALSLSTLTLSINADAVIASAAGARYDAVLVDQQGNISVTGGTNITTATGFNRTVFKKPTFNTTVTITHAANVYIEDAPAVAAGGGAITNPYAMWIDNGVLRYDGAIALGGGAAATLGTIGGGGPGTAAQNKWIKMNVDGTNYFIPLWQ